MRRVLTARDETAVRSHLQHLKQETVAEYRWNVRSNKYNSSRGRKATVDKIIIGKGPAKNGSQLYPQHATHQQMLALTKSLAMPDPRIPAPDATPRSSSNATTTMSGGNCGILDRKSTRLNSSN